MRHLALDIGTAKTFPYSLLRLPQLAQVTSIEFPTWATEEDKQLALNEIHFGCPSISGKYEYSFGLGVQRSCEECAW